ncbi:hypothetical protein BD410DRAFT_842396 [Rickenella mellea]|uniref:Uncharacterized protein n=1 Tax=Rickenella mellea TaxID=50990 RepID=A0A4Y7PV99_9AGAM|nr:hypothetical protein BD410DRAFT_842396 [Rickenella mellea]
MASRSQIRAQHLTALPSLSCALSSLPQAKNLNQLSVHQPTLAKRAADSEAKLQKAISTTSRNTQSGQTPQMHLSIKPQTPSSSEPNSPRSPSPPPLTMRTQPKPKRT